MKEMLGWYGYDRGGGSSSDTSSDVEGQNTHASSLRRTSPQPIVNVPAGCMCCAWCQKVGNAKQFTFKTPSGKKVFCSEQCFTQCRRANFKRNKTCDWCRHVRHTVNYVDFQDGDHQLQFCSDKCLNQYKMNIFCKETQAHLQLHPHLQDQSGSSSMVKEANSLITPDLWLRDCRSQSPDSDQSPSPLRLPSPVIEIKMSPTSSPRPCAEIPREKKQCRDLAKKKTLRNKRNCKINGSVESTINPSSPLSAESASPPKFHTQISHLHPLPPPPPPFLHDQHRPFFFHPGGFPTPHFFHDLRLPPHRLSQRNLHGSNQSSIPPLLPITRPIQPLLPMIPPPNLVPPPTTIVPYPIFLPIPIPIPIPIPLPGMKPSDFEPQKTSTPIPSCSEETNSNNNGVHVDDIPKKMNPIKSLIPPRKRKRIIEISQDGETIRKPKTVHA